MSPRAIVLAFWEAMNANDFARASQWLSTDFEGIWPQSGEWILGRDNFVAINTAYPAEGAWRFEIHSVVCEGPTVVTDVSVSDGVQNARAITFHRVENGLIREQKEFWPDPMPAQPWRAQWVKVMDDPATGT